MAAELDEVLGFLRDVGYGDLYLTQDASPRAPQTAAAAPRPSPSTHPLSAAPAPPSPSGALENAGSEPSRRSLLDELCRQASGCLACRLSETRNHVVFGSGDPDADLMFIGEGPGAEEDRRGLPFVGEAGRLLTRIIEAIDLHRDQVYITNVVKCRPPGNRNPQDDEIAACSGYLERQVDLVQPKLIVALGKVSAQALLGTDGTLKSMRGRWYSYRGVPVRVTYHPAALLRNRGFKRPTWEDMQIVRDELKRSS